jgi:hypothetical protein
MPLEMLFATVGTIANYPKGNAKVAVLTVIEPGEFQAAKISALIGSGCEDSDEGSAHVAPSNPPWSARQDERYDACENV